MEEMRVLFERLRDYPCEESGEALGSIPDAMSAADVEVLFSDTLIAGDLERMFLVRERLLPDLVSIAREMNARGWILKFEEGFRTREMQTRLGRSPEAFDFVLFLHHGLYGSDAREVLLDVGPKFGELFLHFPGRDPHLAFRALGIKENERHRRHDAKC